MKKRYTLFGFKLKNELHELYLTSTLRYIGMTLVYVFIPIYIYQHYHWGLKSVILYWLLRDLLVILFSFVAAELIAKRGLRSSLLIGIFAHIPLFISLAFLQASPLFFWGVIFFESLKNSFWFIALDTDIAMQVNQKNTASKMVVFHVNWTICFIIFPLIGAYIITYLGYYYLYGIAVIFAFFAFIMTFLLGEMSYKFNFRSKTHFKLSIKEMLNKPVPKMNILWGFRAAMTDMAWPIMLLLVLPNITSVGWLTSITLLTVTALSVGISKKLDKKPNITQNVASNGMIIDGISWIGKLGAFNFGSLFLTDTISRVSKGLIITSLNTINFKIHERFEKTLEIMVRRWMALHAGQIGATFILLILTLFLSDLWTLRIGIVILGLSSIVVGFYTKLRKNARAKQ